MLTGIILKTNYRNKNYKVSKNKLKNMLVEIDNNLFVGNVNSRIRNYIIKYLNKRQQNAIIFIADKNYIGFRVVNIGDTVYIISSGREFFSRLE